MAIVNGACTCCGVKLGEGGVRGLPCRCSRRVKCQRSECGKCADHCKCEGGPLIEEQAGGVKRTWGQTDVRQVKGYGYK